MIMIIMEIIKKISENTKIPKSELDADTLLYNSTTISSLALLDLITFVEKKYNIIISPDDLFTDNFKDIKTLADFINRKKEASAIHV